MSYARVAFCPSRLEEVLPHQPRVGRDSEDDRRGARDLRRGDAFAEGDDSHGSREDVSFRRSFAVRIRSQAFFRDRSAEMYAERYPRGGDKNPPAPVARSSIYCR